MPDFIIDALIAALEERIYDLYSQCMEVLTGSWEQHSQSFNNGQWVIYELYLDPEMRIWIEEATENWPWVSAEEYADYCWAAYDADVLERAFSESIEDPVGNMQDKIEKAQELAEVINALEILAAIG